MLKPYYQGDSDVVASLSRWPSSQITFSASIAVLSALLYKATDPCIKFKNRKVKATIFEKQFRAFSTVALAISGNFWRCMRTLCCLFAITSSQQAFENGYNTTRASIFVECWIMFCKTQKITVENQNR